MVKLYDNRPTGAGCNFGLVVDKKEIGNATSA